MATGEIVVVPFQSPGHIFPASVLSIRLASLNYQITLLSPSSPLLHPLIQIIHDSLDPHHLALPLPPPPPPDSLQIPFPSSSLSPFPSPPPPRHDDSRFRAFLSDRINARDPSSPPLLCVVVDVMMSHLLSTCRRLGVPAVSFFTASACSMALDHASSSGSADIPGFPPEMSPMASDLTHLRPPRPPFGPPPHDVKGRGPPPGRGLEETDDAIALLFNTCDDLERPFLEYIAKKANKPVWGVGPLLPARLDDAARGKRESTYEESAVLAWLDSKPARSVLYVSFGSVVSPSDAELAELAAALAESNRPFVWAVQHGVLGHGPDGFPVHRTRSDWAFLDELEKRAGERGLVIRGWAPQLLILSHGSTGGFLTHCGWNSAAEALRCGVPMLTWPIHGDQVHNARMVARQLGAGREIGTARGGVTRDDMARGIEGLMEDGKARERAAGVARDVFGGGFPASSSASLEAFVDFIDGKKEKKCAS